MPMQRKTLKMELVKVLLFYFSFFFKIELLPAKIVLVYSLWAGGSYRALIAESSHLIFITSTIWSKQYEEIRCTVLIKKVGMHRCYDIILMMSSNFVKNGLKKYFSNLSGDFLCFCVFNDKYETLLQLIRKKKHKFVLNFPN